jgi:hypothetical protein
MGARVEGACDGRWPAALSWVLRTHDSGNQKWWKYFASWTGHGRNGYQSIVDAHWFDYPIAVTARPTRILKKH